MLAATALDRALRLTGLKAGLAVVYHELRADGELSGTHSSDEIPLTVSAEAFRQQLQYFRGRYRLVRAGDLREAVLSRRRGEPFPLAITFDDDLRSHLDVVLPILRETGSTATFYLTGASLHGPASFWWERIERALETGVGGNCWDDRSPPGARQRLGAAAGGARRPLDGPARHLGGELETAGLRADHVAALGGAGCEIGFHTRPRASPRTRRRRPRPGDARRSRRPRGASGSRLRSIAYPHGAADARVGAAARSAGFAVATPQTAPRSGATPILSSWAGCTQPGVDRAPRLPAQLRDLRALP